nr:reverse transcriptase domain-containing protein [Tanacetum cinerariifolium]
MMVDNHTMEEMLQAPTEGYGDVIVVPDILAENFEIKTGLLSLIQANQFHGFESNNPHDHIRPFNRITSTLKFRDVSNDAIKLMLFPYSLEGATKICKDARIDKFMDTISKLVETFNKKMTTPATVKAVKETCVIYGGAHPYYDCISTDSNILSACATTGTYNKGNTGFRPQVATTYRTNQNSQPGFPLVQNNQNRYNQNQNRGNNYQAPIQHPQVELPNEFSKYKQITKTSIRTMQNQIDNFKAGNEIHSSMQNQINNDTASTSGLGSLPSNTIANPRGDLKAITTRSGVSYDGPLIPPCTSSLPKVVERVPEVTKDTVQLSTENIQPSMAQTQVPIDKPVVAPKPKPTIPYPLLNNKEKLFDLATTPVNENCSAVILKKLPKKLGDLDKFLIPCDFLELEECLALADLGASINLMPLSIWRKLSLPELSSTQMILELADRSTTRLARIAKVVFVKVGKFHFPTDLVVFDYVVDPRVPLILGRPFLRTGRDLIDVYGFSNNSKSGNPTPTSDTIIALFSLSLTPFEGGDFNLEKIEACLTSKSIPPGIDDTDFDLEGDIRLLEELLNKDQSSSPLPSKELNVEEIKAVKSSIDEPSKLELTELPSHLEYAFLEGIDKLSVIISKELKDEEKSALLKVLKSQKRAIVWKIFDIKGIDPCFCTHKILMEDDFKLAVQHQRRVNSKIHEVIKKEVIKLFDAGVIYPISDSP